MKAISNGRQYDIYNDTLKTYDKLPAGVYSIIFDKMTGFHLVKKPNIEITEKIYGIHEEKGKKVFKTFKAFNRNLGVILSGDKGIGKSLFAKFLAVVAIENDYPLIIVDKFIPGIANYIESIEQEAVVLFDEFDKTFANIRQSENEGDPQASLLTLFDGVSGGKKLFVITCNEIGKLNEYLLNRPGRFHYHFRFNYPNDSELCEYLTDNLKPAYYGEIKKVISFSHKVKINYDCLRAIAFEINNGESFEEAIKDLNILNINRENYVVTIVFKNGLVGKQLDTSTFNIFYDSEVTLYEIMINSKYSPINVSFIPSKAIESEKGCIIKGEDTEITMDTNYSDSVIEEYTNMNLEIDYITLEREKPKNIHFNL